MNRNTLIKAGLLAVVAVSLAACGGGGGGSATNNVPPPTLQDQFGTQFGIDYRAPANSDPVKPMAGDIIALSLTTDPLPLH